MNNKETRRTRMAVMVTIDEVTHRRHLKHHLVQHIMELHNPWAMRLATQIKEYVDEGKPPDYEGSLVMARMFHTACRMLRIK